MPTIKDSKASLKAAHNTEIPCTHTIQSDDTLVFIKRGILMLKSVALAYYHPLQLHGACSEDDRVVGCVEVCCSLNSIAQLCVIQGLYLKLD